MTRIKPVIFLCAAVLALVPSVSCADEPIDILRKNIERGIAVLEDGQYELNGDRNAQLDELCNITREIFDPDLFVRLALASDWKLFSEDERGEFIEVFATFLCRYYLSRLQDRYDGERVNFTEQTLKSGTRASVLANVIWNGMEIPFEVRMVLRNEKWTAYDLVVGGVSAVKLYRAEFRSILREGTPADLIASIREKTPDAPSIGEVEAAPPPLPAEPEPPPIPAPAPEASRSSET